MRAHALEGHFAGGSMGPKVEAALRFVETSRRAGRVAVITDLDSIIDGIAGEAGTVVVPD